MQKIVVCLIGMVAFMCLANAQELDLSKKQTKAFRTEKVPKIDGELTEMDWQNAPIATDLVELQRKRSVNHGLPISTIPT